jgi:hypothetical protein
MGAERQRYSFKEVGGPSETISFRVPKVAHDMLMARIEAAPDLTNKTEAMQDALVVWIMLEELREAKREEPADEQ